MAYEAETGLAIWQHRRRKINPGFVPMSLLGGTT